jgi:murein DD-endopeptidase MepM/ murein hydrolase activator NlpD
MIGEIINQHVNKRIRGVKNTRQKGKFRLYRSNREILLPKNFDLSTKIVSKKQKRFVFPSFPRFLILVTGICVIIFSIYTIAQTETLTHKSESLIFESDPDIQSAVEDFMISEKGNPKEEKPLSHKVIETLRIVNYTVKKGDTISSIANQFKVNLDTIVSYNSIKTARTVTSGVILKIPNTNGLKYVVRTGDCISCIARKFDVELNKILDWNDVSSDTIKPKDVLFIPGARMSKVELNKVFGTFFMWPVTGIISSDYGFRIHPIDGTRNFHNGLDIAGVKGMTIKAASSGKVLKIGKNFVYGNFIIVQHEDGYQTFYGHLSKINTSERKYVEQGEKIGEMGNSGYSTGDHLHFTIYKNGETVDPQLFLKK